MYKLVIILLFATMLLCAVKCPAQSPTISNTQANTNAERHIPNLLPAAVGTTCLFFTVKMIVKKEEGWGFPLVMALGCFAIQAFVVRVPH